MDPVHPDGTKKVLWDGIVVLFVVYVSFMVSSVDLAPIMCAILTLILVYRVQVPFSQSFGEVKSTKPLDLATDIIFLIDLWLSFRTSPPCLCMHSLHYNMSNLGL